MRTLAELTQLIEPLEKGGFVALSGVLLLVLVAGGAWVVKKLLDVISRNSEVIAGCTAAITRTNELSVKGLEVQSQILERITALDTRCEERCRG